MQHQTQTDRHADRTLTERLVQVMTGLRLPALLDTPRSDATRRKAHARLDDLLDRLAERGR